VESVLSQLHKAETRAHYMRKSLGLDPSSRSKIARRILDAQQADLARLATMFPEEWPPRGRATDSQRVRFPHRRDTGPLSLLAHCWPAEMPARTLLALALAASSLAV
jgi:hypothetical protein